MTRKQFGRNTGNSGRINASGAELQKLGSEIGDAVEVEVAASEDIARVLIDNKNADTYLIVTPA